MTYRQPYRIEITLESYPTRIRVGVEPRSVLFPPARFATDADADAESAAATLRDRTGFTIVDRREA